MNAWISQQGGDWRDPTSLSTAGSLKEETLSYWVICPNPSHQSRPSPLGNGDNSQECAWKCQGSHTEAVNLSQRRLNMSISSTQKTSGPMPTHGSAAEATRDGGGRVYIRYNDRKAHTTIATEKYSTNFNAEAQAHKKAAIEIRDNLPRTKPNVVIFTDALSALNKLKIPARRISTRWKLHTLVDFAAQTPCSGSQHTAGPKEVNKQTGLLGKEASWTKRTDTPLTSMKRPSSKPLQDKMETVAPKL